MCNAVFLFFFCVNFIQEFSLANGLNGIHIYLNSTMDLINKRMLIFNMNIVIRDAYLKIVKVRLNKSKDNKKCFEFNVQKQ